MYLNIDEGLKIRIFKTKNFVRWARKEKLSDTVLKSAIKELEEGLRSIFIFGFSKNDRENLDAEEKEMYKNVAKMYLGAPMSALEKMCAKGQLVEVYYEKK